MIRWNGILDVLLVPMGIIALDWLVGHEHVAAMLVLETLTTYAMFAFAVVAWVFYWSVRFMPNHRAVLVATPLTEIDDEDFEGLQLPQAHLHTTATALEKLYDYYVTLRGVLWTYTIIFTAFAVYTSRVSWAVLMVISVYGVLKSIKHLVIAHRSIVVAMNNAMDWEPEKPIKLDHSG